MEPNAKLTRAHGGHYRPRPPKRPNPKPTPIAPRVVFESSPLFEVKDKDGGLIRKVVLNHLARRGLKLKGAPPTSPIRLRSSAASHGHEIVRRLRARGASSTRISRALRAVSREK